MFGKIKKALVLQALDAAIAKEHDAAKKWKKCDEQRCNMYAYAEAALLNLRAQIARL